MTFDDLPSREIQGLMQYRIDHMWVGPAQASYHLAMRRQQKDVPMTREEKMETALRQIMAWSEAYPLTVFAEPDYKKAAELLRAGGMTLDSISADAMRHVVEGVGKIAREALE